MNEREAMAILVSAQGVSYGQRERALMLAGSAMDVLGDPYACEQALGTAGVGAIRRAMQGAERMLDGLEQNGVHLVVRGAAGYPSRLAQIARPPHLLFVLGRENLNETLSFSIVGTRSADNYGLRHTRRIARELAGAGACIVSGLALGVDGAAHWGALDAGGRTIAVLGGALDRLYPEKNRPLMERIVESGGSIVSEYPPGMAPTKYSFIQRNRIVAGMSLGVLVTQAPMKSGALSTARFALDEGREVFAMPGDIDRPGSALPNRLISEGAKPVTCAADILDMLVIEPPHAKKNVRQEEPQPPAPRSALLPRKLDAQEQAVYDLLLAGDADFDALCEKTGMDSDALSGVLMMLELDGVVTALPGLVYRLA